MQRVVFYVISLVSCLGLNWCGRPPSEFRADDLTACERGALDRWGGGNPYGFLESFLKPQLKNAPSAANTSNTPVGDLVNDWQQQKEGLMKIADAMPKDKFGYRPTAAQRSYGEHILHIAESNVAVFKLMGAKAHVPSFSADRTKTKAQLLAALAASYDYGTAVLREQTADTLGTAVNTSFAGPCTRSRLAWQMLAHSMDGYGQMAVYLRLNGIVPPASRGV